MAIVFSGVSFSGGFQIQPTFAPNAPTIGTATSTGSTTANVSFTAPSYGGSTTITTYTATSTPGNITGTLSQSGSGTISVTGLTASTSYTFTVTATNSNGTSVASSASNSITTAPSGPTVIGQSYGGGYYAGQISTTGNGVATHYLIVAPKASGQTITGYATGDFTGSPTSWIDGPGNSTYMNNSNYQAAPFCKALTIGGYTDWYMPANYEVEILYYNLKPTTASNIIGGSLSGNPYAVPSQSGQEYTSGTPARTTATAFMSGGSEAFDTGSGVYYWTSTDARGRTSFRDAYILDFVDGSAYSGPKATPYRVRAVRRVPI
jgi:hypothetical protein